MLEFDRFDASACGFPPPAVPLLPALRWDALTLVPDDGAMAALPEARHFARGRYALHAAFELAGVGPGTTVLAPSYHCRTMIDPALALGAQVAFYTLDAQLAPSVAQVTALLDSLARANGNPKALVLPHYFGFAQAPAIVEALAALCAQRHIVLVEDCSHGWLIAQAARHTVTPLRMVMASPYKFFATPDGGTLWHARGQPGPPQRAPGKLAELKAVVDLLQRRRWRPPGSSAAAAGPIGVDHVEHAPALSIHYRQSDQPGCGLALSRAIVRHTRTEQVAQRRRANFRRLLDASSAWPAARPLFDSVPADCAPYMFPLWLARPLLDFDRLKRRGVPIWRWDDMARSSCDVARAYRLQLLHLPCHQDLSEAQMAWLCAQLAEVLAHVPQRTNEQV